MKCNACGFEAAEDYAFCPECGNKLEAEEVQTQLDPTAEPSEPEAPAAPEASAEQVEAPTQQEEAPTQQEEVPAQQEPAVQQTCMKCGQPRVEGTDYCVYCGHGYGENAKYTSTPYTVPEEPKPKYSGKEYRPKRKIGVILGVIAAVLAVIAMVLYFTNCFGFYGPLTKTALAARKTLLKKGSFTVEYKIDDSQDITMYVELNPEKRHLQVYSTTETTEKAIYDGFYITRYEDHYFCMDISDELDELFDKYEDSKGGDFDLEEFLNGIQEGLYDQVDEYVDFDEVTPCLIKCFRKLNNNSWLKKNAGYKKTLRNGATVHKFNVDLYAAGKDLLKTCEPIFEDEDDYDLLLDELKANKSYLRDTDVEIKVGIQWGKLVSLDVDVMGDEFTAEFTNIGRTNVNDSDMETFLNEALEATGQSR